MAVTPKQKSLALDMKGALAKINEEHPVLAERFYVEERLPPYTNEYDYGLQYPSPIVVSDFFDTKEDAEQWINDHQSDLGTLHIVRQVAREYKYIHWS